MNSGLLTIGTFLSKSPTLPVITSLIIIEKLEVEMLNGYYESTSLWRVICKTTSKYILTEETGTRGTKYLLARQTSSYWGGHKHNLSIELGDARSLRTNLDFTLNKIGGVMKRCGQDNHHHCQYFLPQR